MARILIVEDNEDLRKMLAWVLQPHGYETLQAATGKEGIEKAIAAQPGLILLDIRLPDMNGVDVARAIKTNTRTAHIPIVGWSAVFRRALARRSTARWNGRLHGKATFSASN